MSANPWRSEKVRRTRAEVQPIADRLEAEIAELNPGVEFHFGGSWRRGAESIGDIDTLFVTESGTLNEVVLPPSVVIHRGGPDQAQGDIEVGGITMHVDFWATSPAGRGAYLWFITGPKELNIAMRVAAQAKGYCLSQRGLFDENKVQQDDGTEASIARLLGYRWAALVEPTSRERWDVLASDAKTTTTQVASSSGKGFYTLTQTGTYFSCSCPGFTYRAKCHHVEEAKKSVT